MSTDGSSLWNVNHHYVCFQKASCSGHNSSSFSEVSVLRCVLTVWSGSTDPTRLTLVWFSQTACLTNIRADLRYYDMMLDSYKPSETDLSPVKTATKALMDVRISNWWSVTIIYITESSAQTPNIKISDTELSSIEKEPLLKPLAAKLLKLCIMFDFWVQS